jgi:hypothetical protein
MLVPFAITVLVLVPTAVAIPVLVFVLVPTAVAIPVAISILVFVFVPVAIEPQSPERSDLGWLAALSRGIAIKYVSGAFGDARRSISGCGDSHLRRVPASICG